MRPAIVSGIVTGDVSVSYWPIFSSVPSNSPRNLCKRYLGPVSFSVLSGELSFKLNKRKYFSHSHFFSNYT